MYYCVIFDDDMYSGHNATDYQNDIAHKLGISPKTPFCVLSDKLREVDNEVLGSVFPHYPDFESLKQGFIYSGITGIKDAKDECDIMDAYNKQHHDAHIIIFDNLTEAVLGIWHK